MSPANISHYLEVLSVLREKFPSLRGTDVNDRTVEVWRRHWIDRESENYIAVALGWSQAAVSWHLRRAERLLQEPSG